MSQRSFKPTWIRHLQLFLSSLALALCLYSVSSLHQHESGYHVAQSDCVSCDIETLLAHGAVTSSASVQTPVLLSIPYVARIKNFSRVEASFAYAARAPPLNS